MITRFVTATGTGLGKTLVTAALCHQLLAQGRSVRALKPIVTGLSEATIDDSDPAILLKGLGKWPSFETRPPDAPQDERLIVRPYGEPHPEEAAQRPSRRMGQDFHSSALDSISPFRFAAPLAPSMAAAREGRALDMKAVLAFCGEAARGPEDILLIEGVGGVMVPLAPAITVLDWIKALDCPAILVTGSYLGSLSHTLSALAVLRAAQIPIAGVVVSETEGSAVDLSDTADALRPWVREAPLLTVPRIPGRDPWQRAPRLTRLI